MTDYSTFLAEFERHSTAMFDSAAMAAAETPVPSCGSWTMTDLLGHIGALHRWVTALTDLAPTDKAAGFEPPPSEYAELLGWCRDGAARLREKLAALGPEHECKAFRWAPPNTAFWARRQAHEIAIHRLDADLAIGADPGPLYEPELAADGVAELLVGMLPNRLPERDAADPRGTVCYRAQDAGRYWLAELGDAVRISEVETPSSADTVVSGSADAVFRAVWGRPSTAEVSGDRALLGALASP